jgi:hypothetical protein
MTKKVLLVKIPNGLGNKTAINKGKHIYELNAYTNFDILMEYLQNLQ